MGSECIPRQCQMLEISRSSLYYKPAPVNETDLRLMKLIDGIHLDKPYLGTRRICEKLCDMGEKIGRKHVRTLMNRMSITAIYNKPRLSKPCPQARLPPQRGHTDGLVHGKSRPLETISLIETGTENIIRIPFRGLGPVHA